MTQKPLISINKFSGMGQNGILYCEGFYPEVDNGKSVMGEGFTPVSIFNSSTTGFSTLGNIYSILNLSTINSFSSKYQLYLDNGGRFFANQFSGTTITDGVIHSFTTGYSYPDAIETVSGNILYTGIADKIGKGFRGKATGGSTTTLSDTTKNFTALGIAVNDKVTNLKTGIEYTISSITSDGGTNNVLNFTASGTNTTGANDEYIVWVDDHYASASTAAVWQNTGSEWVRQFKLYGDQYIYTNGNYLGVISADESTIDDTYKQLPAKTQALCLDVNVSNILVGCSYRGKGSILLWDGYSDGWNNVLEFDRPIIALEKYKSGWVFISNGVVYYTDGYQVSKMYDIDNGEKIATNSLNPSSHNSLLIFEDNLYIASQNNNFNRVIPGVYVIDLNNTNKGFTHIRPFETTRPNGVPYCIELVNSLTNTLQIQIGGDDFCSYITHGSVGVAYSDKSMILYLSLPEPRRITGIGLNISRWLRDFSPEATDAYTRSIQVSIGDGNRGLITYPIQAKDDLLEASKITVDGTNWDNSGVEVGDEVYINDYDHPDNFGERSFITSITGAGTATEEWAMSPSFSITTPVSETIVLKILKVKKLDRKTLNYNSFKNEIMFYNPNTGILSNKIFIEIVAYGQANGLPININEIKVYGD